MNKNIFFDSLCLLVIYFILTSFKVIDNEQHIDKVLIGGILLNEPIEIERNNEYVNIKFELPLYTAPQKELSFFIMDESNNEKIFCQILNRDRNIRSKTELFELLFPISLKAKEKRKLKILLKRNLILNVKPKFIVKGIGLETVFEHKYYSANLSESNETDAKNNSSGQIQSITIKDSSKIIIKRSGIRVRWAPSFLKEGSPNYKILAQWDSPEYISHIGNYCFSINRWAKAPELSELEVTDKYCFFAEKPFPIFESKMEFTKRVVMLNLLRNNEMTMDSFFTHLAFQGPNDIIVDLKFSERYEKFEEQPI